MKITDFYLYGKQIYRWFFHLPLTKERQLCLRLNKDFCKYIIYRISELVLICEIDSSEFMQINVYMEIGKNFTECIKELPKITLEM